MQIFNEVDYRKILKEFYTNRKESMPLYSYRIMGEKLGLDGAQLFRVIQSLQHLPPRCVPNAKTMLGLIGRASEYFDLIFAAAKTRNIAKRNHLMDQAYALRDVERRKLISTELNLFSFWWFPVVLSYLEVTGGYADAAQIAKAVVPNISEQQATEALTFLKNNGFIVRMASGRYKLAKPHLTASGPEKAAAIRAYQKQTMVMGSEAIDRFPNTERNASTLTIAIDEECFTEICGMAQEFRRQIQKRIEEATSPDRVIQITMSIFPVTNVIRKE